MEWYRACITAAAEGHDIPAPPSIPDGKFPVHSGYTPTNITPPNLTPPVYSPPSEESVGELFSAAFNWVGVKVAGAAQKVQDDGWAETLGSALHAVAEKSKEAVKTVTDDEFIEKVKTRASVVGSWVGLTEQEVPHNTTKAPVSSAAVRSMNEDEGWGELR